MTTKMHISAEDSKGNKGSITLESLQDEINQLKTVTVKNGTEKIMPLPQVVAETWEAVQLLRDIQKMGEIIKRHPTFIKITKYLISGGLILQIIRWAIDYREWLWGLFK
jgi:hypothetical protein